VIKYIKKYWTMLLWGLIIAIVVPTWEQRIVIITSSSILLGIFFLSEDTK